MTSAQERQAAQEVRDAEDFTSFWDAQARPGGKWLRNVFGIDVQLPASLPLIFEIEARRLVHTQDDDKAREMVGYLYGPDAMDHWVAHGCDSEQFAVLLMWGSANASGHDMTLTQAREEVGKAMAAGQGKAPGPGLAPTGPNRQERRAGPMPGLSSSGTGVPSWPTSDASTESAARSLLASPSKSSDFWSAASPNSRSGD